MLKRSLLLLVLTLSLFIPVLAQSGKSNKAQDPDDSVIKVDTSVVSLDIQVLNKKTNTPVNGLTENDFEIYEDNVKQVISNFSQDKTPLSVLLLLDVSSSIDPILPQIKNGATQALQLLKPEDEVGVMAFATGTAALNSFSKDKTTIINNIDEARRRAIDFGQATYLNEALYDASIHMKKFCSPNYRKVVIVITDNVINKPPDGHSTEETVNMLLEAGITVCGVTVNSLKTQALIQNQQPQTSFKSTFAKSFVLEPPQRGGGGGNSGGSKGNTGTTNTRTQSNTTSPTIAQGNTTRIFNRNIPGDKVEVYSKETGGEVIDAREKSISNKFTVLVEHLRARYSVGYTPATVKNDGKLRKIKVKIISTGQNYELQKGDLAVETRKGYFVPKTN